MIAGAHVRSLAFAILIGSIGCGAAQAVGGAARETVVLTRRPKAWEEVDLPFEVYVGNKKTMRLGEWLAADPHPAYVAMEPR